MTNADSPGLRLAKSLCMWKSMEGIDDDIPKEAQVFHVIDRPSDPNDVVIYSAIFKKENGKLAVSEGPFMTIMNGLKLQSSVHDRATAGMLKHPGAKETILAKHQKENPSADLKDELLAMHQAFDWVFFKLMPDAPKDAIVYEVDAGEPDDPNVTIRAAVFEGGMEPTGKILEGPFTKIVNKEHMAEFAEAPGFKP